VISSPFHFSTAARRVEENPPIDKAELAVPHPADPYLETFARWVDFYINELNLSDLTGFPPNEIASNGDPEQAKLPLGTFKLEAVD